MQGLPCVEILVGVFPAGVDLLAPLSEVEGLAVKRATLERIYNVCRRYAGLMYTWCAEDGAPAVRISIPMRCFDDFLDAVGCAQRVARELAQESVLLRCPGHAPRRIWV
jgi:hypothetical protein